MKAKKTKKNFTAKLKTMHDRIDRQQDEINILTEREKSFRERTLRLIIGVRDGLREVNEHNFRFMSKILVERLDKFIDEEPDHTEADEIESGEG